VAQRTVTLARRDLPGKQGKRSVPLEGAATAVADALEEVQQALYQRALEFRKAHTHQPRSYDEFKQVVEAGWAIAWWCGRECEAAIKDDTKATTRNILSTNRRVAVSASIAVSQRPSGRCSGARLLMPGMPPVSAPRRLTCKQCKTPSCAAGPFRTPLSNAALPIQSAV